MPAFRPYRVRVARVERLSPHFRRIVFIGDDLVGFGTDAYDQRIKLLLPPPSGIWPDPLLFDPDAIRRGSWYERWRALPPARRYVMRTYTIRRADPSRHEVTIDFVIHDDPGPAGSFAMRARPGDEAAIVGPVAASPDSAIGIDFHPGYADRLLLVGDETAVPAVGAILGSLLRDGWEGIGVALLEVPTSEDAVALPEVPGIRVDWGFRGGPSPGSSSQRALAGVSSGDASPADICHGDTLRARIDAALVRLGCASAAHGVAAGAGSVVSLPDVDVDHELLWEVPSVTEAARSLDGLYAWVAGEAAAVRDLRRRMVAVHHMDRRRIAFMGYWRDGKSEI